MVSSCHYLATFAGTRMFQRGGNAIDAGVAAGIALNVVERHLTDFGGVAPCIVFRPGMDRPETIDGLGHWPASLDLDTYRDRKSTRLKSSHDQISYAGFCLKKKKKNYTHIVRVMTS